MKIYQCSQTKISGYDTYDSFICAAESSGDARSMLPEYARINDSWYSWCSPEHVTVTEIGIAAPGIERGIILASFNAG